MHPVVSVQAIPGGPGAIGNVTCTGVSPALLPPAQRVEPHTGWHVAFACADTCELEGKRFNDSVSIPIGKATAQDEPRRWATNGQALTPERPYPLRVVVPAYAVVG